jgi:hypothetical protein
MADRVFISSTCYDLIDLRAELEKELKDLGLKPIMSDGLSHEFNVVPDRNSIESCLVNVKKCDVFIIILSQRYGRSLKDTGYPDVSATHLEYLEAKKLRKPIYMYVRDRLEADFNVWNKNQGKRIMLPWVKSEDEAIFSLLKQHRRLSSRIKHSNWFWTFRDSVELRERLRIDLKKQSGEAILSRLMGKGRIPYLFPHINSFNIDHNEKKIYVDITIKNVGTSVAIEPLIRIFETENNMKNDGINLNEEQVSALSPQETIRGNPPGFVIKNIMGLSLSFKAVFWMSYEYKTIEGYLIRDEFSFDYYSKGRDGKPESLIPRHFCKRFISSSAISIKTEDE